MKYIALLPKGDSNCLAYLLVGAAGGIKHFVFIAFFCFLFLDVLMASHVILILFFIIIILKSAH